MIRMIVPLKETRQAILAHPLLHCTNKSALSQILNFKRNNLRALRVRNYAMNNAKSLYVEYEEDKA